MAGAINLSVAGAPGGRETPAFQAGRRAGKKTSWFPGRAMRVCILLSVIVALSLTDLYLTLLYVTHTGMDEANPLARALLRYSSLETVALFKAGTVGLCTYILFRARWSRSGEIGAWLGAAVLIALTAHWMKFSAHQEIIAEAASIYSVTPDFNPAFGPDRGWVDRRHLGVVTPRRAG